MADFNTVVGQTSGSTSIWIPLTPGTNNQIAVANNPALTKDIWFHRISVRVRNTSATAYNMALGVYEGVTPSTAPRVMHATVNVEGNFDGTKSVDFAGSNGERGVINQRYVVAVTGQSSALQVMGAAGTGKRRWSRSNGAVSMPDPFGEASVTLEDVPLLYAWAEDNVAPSMPTGLSPINGASVSTITPTFSWTHVDPNTDVGDTILGAQVLVYDANGTNIWAPYFTATAAEQSSKTMSRVYSGPTLTSGVSYTWKVRTRDLAGTYGPYSATRSFSIVTGTLTMDPNTPAPKVEVTSGLTFAATWSHSGGLALQKARARLAIGGSVVWEGAAAGFTPATGNVANNGTLTFTQALAGMPTLSAGQTYQVAVQGQDTNGVWSPYSAYRTLRTNAPPQTPAALSPNSTQPSTTRPKLTFTAQDPDVTAGYPDPDLTATVRLKDSAGTVRFTRTATLVNSAAGTWEYQITATDEPALASGASVSRLWNAQLNDGTANGYASPDATYVYASGPVVTITAPGATLANATGPISWTVAGMQVSRTVKIWSGSTASGTPLHTNTATTGSLSYTIPTGVIYNGNTYTIVVEVTDDLGITGASLAVTTTATFPVPPAPVGFLASLVAADGEPDPSRVLLSWQASAEPPDVFVEYRVSRRFENEPEAAAVTLAQLVNTNQASIVDEHAPTGGSLIYSLRQVTRDANNQLLLSAAADVQIGQIDPEATWEGGTILVNVVDPTIRAFLRFAESVDVATEKNRLEISTWAGGPALMIDTGNRREVETATFNVVRDMAHPELTPPDEVMQQVRALNAHPGPVSVRDGRRPRWFAVVDRAESDRPIGTYDVSLTLTEVDVQDGLEL